MKKKILLATAVLLATAISLFAQSETAASGGKATGSGGSVSFTVGQVANQTHTGANGSIS